MFLDELSQDELNAVEAVGTIREFKPKDIIIVEGLPGTSMFLLVTGKVEVLMKIDATETKRLTVMGSMSIFGEMCFLGVGTRSATVVAMTNCTLLEFDRATFVELMANQPAIGMKAYKGLAEDLAQRLAKSDAELKDALAWALEELNKIATPQAPLEIPKHIQPSLAKFHRSTGSTRPDQ